MAVVTELLLPVFYASLCSAAFAIIYNVYGTGILVCALGGALGWLSYLLSAPLLHSDIGQMFVAAVTISVYAEIMARVRKFPVTGYQMVAALPMVPGGGIYYTMEHAINGEIDAFLESFLHTLGLAGAIAVGVLLVSSVVRMYQAIHHPAGKGPQP